MSLDTIPDGRFTLQLAPKRIRRYPPTSARQNEVAAGWSQLIRRSFCLRPSI